MSNYDNAVEDLPMEETRRPIDPLERMANQEPARILGLIESGMVGDHELAQLVGSLAWMPSTRSTVLAMQHLQHPDRGVRFQAMSVLNAKMERNEISPGIKEIIGQKITRLTAERRLP